MDKETVAMKTIVTVHKEGLQSIILFDELHDAALYLENISERQICIAVLYTPHIIADSLEEMGVKIGIVDRPEMSIRKVGKGEKVN